MFAFRFVMAFGSVYLYKLGYSVAEIALFWALYYGIKTVGVPVAAVVVAQIGPKHGLFIANLLFAAGLVCLMATNNSGIGDYFVVFYSRWRWAP